MLSAIRRLPPLACLALLACGGPIPPTAEAMPGERPLRIAIDQWAGYYPLVLADELGFLGDAGVRITLALPQNTDRMLAAFAARDFDAIGACCADAITLTRAVPDLQVALLSDESRGGDQILGKQPVHGPADLRGRRIGTNLGGFGEVFVRRFLATHGVDPGEVHLVQVDAADVPKQCAAGTLDFGHTWEPYATAARATGMVSVFDSAATPGLIVDGLLIRAETRTARAAEIAGLRQAWFRALDWWHQHPAEGDRRIEARLGLQPGQARPTGITLLDAEANRALLAGSPPPLVKVLGEYIDFFAARGLLLQKPDPLAMLPTAFHP